MTVYYNFPVLNFFLWLELNAGIDCIIIFFLRERIKKSVILHNTRIRNYE